MVHITKQNKKYNSLYRHTTAFLVRGLLLLPKLVLYAQRFEKETKKIRIHTEKEKLVFVLKQKQKQQQQQQKSA